jgi:hypothetical protein
MDTIVITTENDKTEEPHKFSYRLTNSMTLDGHYICLTNLSMYYTWKNIKASYDNNTFSYRINDKKVDITLRDGSYSINDINNYMHMIMIGNKDAVKDNYPIGIYQSFTYNKTAITVKPNCELILGIGMAKVLGFSNLTVTNDSHGDLTPKLERVNNILVHCSLAKNNFAKSSSLIYSFVPDGEFGYLLHKEPRFPMWRSARKCSEWSIDVWFTDQKNRPLEIEDDVLIEIQIVPESFVSNA